MRNEGLNRGPEKGKEDRLDLRNLGCGLTRYNDQWLWIVTSGEHRLPIWAAGR